MPKLSAAIITEDNDDLVSSVMLLSVRLRNLIVYQSFVEAGALDTRQGFDFLVVGSRPSVREVVSVYQREDKTPPLMIYVMMGEREPDSLPDFSAEFPGCQIHAVPQAQLTTLDVTLKYNLFEHIVNGLFPS